MYFDRYELFDKEHRINDYNQLKTKVMVQNQVNMLDCLEKWIIDRIIRPIDMLTTCISEMQ